MMRLDSRTTALSLRESSIGRRIRIRAISAVAILILAFPACREAPRSVVVARLIDLFPGAHMQSESRSIDFGTAASLPFLLEGWEDPDPGKAWVWAVGRESSVRLDLGEPQPRTAVLRCSPFSFPRARAQTVDVIVNGKPVKRMRLRPGFFDYRVPIPARAFVEGENRITFRYGYARAARDVIPGSKGERPLAVAWDSLRLEGPTAGQPHVRWISSRRALVLPFGTRLEYRMKVAPDSTLMVEKLLPWPAEENRSPGKLVVELSGDVPSRTIELPLSSASTPLSATIPVESEGSITISLRADPGAAPAEGTAGLQLVEPTLQVVRAERQAAKLRGGNTENEIRKLDVRTPEPGGGGRAVYLQAVPFMQPGLRYRVVTTATGLTAAQAANANSRLAYAWILEGEGEPSAVELTRLPLEAASGATVTAVRTIRAPKEPGRYLLEAAIRAQGAPWRANAWGQVAIPIQVQAATPPQSEPPAGRIRLVGLDGATWRLLLPWIEQGKLPNLGRLVHRAAWGPLESFPPTLSPAVWTTIATGRRRAKHGIDAFQRRDPKTDSMRTIRRTDRKVPAFWNFVSGHGLTTNIVNWMVTVPVEPVNGTMIGRLRSTTASTIYPPDLVEEMSAVLEGAEDDHAADGSEQEKWLQLVNGDLTRLIAAERFLEKRSPADIAAYYTHSTDAIQHRFWKYMEPTLFRDSCFGLEPEDVDAYHDAILKHYQRIDDWIAEVQDTGDIFVLVSDHGASPERDPRIYVQTNNVLSKLGYCQLNDAGEVNHETSDAFDCTTNPWNPKLSICLNDKKQSGTKDDSGALLARMAKDLAALRFSNGERLFHRVERARAGNVDLTAEPSRLTCAHLGEEITLPDGRARGDELLVLHDVSGTHSRDGILALAGGPISPGPIDGATIVDVAPTLLYLLGLSIPQTLDGEPLTEIIDPDYLLRHPVESVASDGAATPEVAGTPDQGEPALDETTRERLRALGYIQ